MKILHFAETTKGGPATHLNELLPFQVEKHDVTVLIPDRDIKQIDVRGAKIKTFPDTSRSLAGVWQLRKHLLKELATEAYDIVHLHSSFAGFAGRTIAQREGQKTIYCARGWAFSMAGNPIKIRAYAMIERALALRTDRIINISGSEDKAARSFGLPERKMKVVYNGISDANWSELAPDSKMRRLLFVGRYDRQKGVDVLCDAMLELKEEGFSLKTIGASVLGDDNVSIPDYVEDVGWQSREQIQKHMADSDVVVMPSRWEGFGFVAAEALRAGRPIVACSVGGLPEIIVDGVTGALCEPNSINALSAAIRRVSEMDPADVSKACRARYLEKFTASRMANEIEELYSEVHPVGRNSFAYA